MEFAYSGLAAHRQTIARNLRHGSATMNVH
jgi:hypothetical protein